MTTKSVKIHGLLKALCGIEVGTNGDKLPVDPRLGTIVQEGNNTLIWTELNGVKLWYPLIKGDDAITFTFKQETAAVDWVVTHGLGSQDLVYSVRDHEGNVIGTPAGFTPDPTNPNNKITLHFVEAIKGSVFIVGKRQYVVVEVPPTPEPGPTRPIFDYMSKQETAMLAYFHGGKFVDNKLVAYTNFGTDAISNKEVTYSAELFGVTSGNGGVTVTAGEQNNLGNAHSIVLAAIMPNSITHAPEVIASTIGEGTTGYSLSFVSGNLELKTFTKEGVPEIYVLKLTSQFRDGLQHILAITLNDTTAILYVDGKYETQVTIAAELKLAADNGTMSLLNALPVTNTQSPLKLTGLSLYGTFAKVLSASEISAIHGNAAYPPLMEPTGKPDYRWRFDKAPSAKYVSVIGNKTLTFDTITGIEQTNGDMGKPNGAWSITSGVLAKLNSGLIAAGADFSMRFKVKVPAGPASVGHGCRAIAGQFNDTNVGETTATLTIEDSNDSFYPSNSLGDGGYDARVGTGLGEAMTWPSERGNYLRADRWVSMVVVKRGKVLELYMNGIAENFVELGELDIADGIFTMFGDPSHPTHAFLGSIEEAAVWKDRALTRMEILFSHMMQLDSFWPDDEVIAPPATHAKALYDYLAAQEVKPVAMYRLQSETESYKATTAITPNGSVSYVESTDGRDEYAVATEKGMLVVAAEAAHKLKPNTTWVFNLVAPRITVPGSDSSYILSYAGSEKKGFVTLSYQADRLNLSVSPMEGNFQSINLYPSITYMDGLSHNFAFTFSDTELVLYIDGKKVSSANIATANLYDLVDEQPIALLNYFTSPSANYSNKHGVSLFAVIPKLLSDEEILSMCADTENTVVRTAPSAPTNRWRFDKAPRETYPANIGDTPIKFTNSNVIKFTDNDGGKIGHLINDQSIANVTGVIEANLLSGTKDFTITYRAHAHTYGEVPNGGFYNILATKTTDGLGNFSSYLWADIRRNFTSGFVFGDGAYDALYGIGTGTGGNQVPRASNQQYGGLSNKFFNYAVVRKGNVIEFYHDGALTDRRTYAEFTIADVPLVFLKGAGCLGEPEIGFTGAIQDLNIWSGKALTRYEIEWLHLNDDRTMWPDDTTGVPQPTYVNPLVGYIAAQEPLFSAYYDGEKYIDAAGDALTTKNWAATNTKNNRCYEKFSSTSAGMVLLPENAYGDKLALRNETTMVFTFYVNGNTNSVEQTLVNGTDDSGNGWYISALGQQLTFNYVDKSGAMVSKQRYVFVSDKVPYTVALVFTGTGIKVYDNGVLVITLDIADIDWTACGTNPMGLFNKQVGGVMSTPMVYGVGMVALLNKVISDEEALAINVMLGTGAHAWQ